MNTKNNFAFGALLLYVGSIPNEAYFVLESVGSVSRIIGGILLCLWLFGIAVRGKILKPPFEIWLFVAFFVFSFASTLWTAAPELTIQRNITLVQQILFLFIMITVVDNSIKRLELVWFAYIFGALVTAIIMVSMYLTGQVSQMWWEFERYASFEQDPNTVAVMLSIGILLCIYLFENAKIRLLRIFYLISIMIMIAAILLTGSRGGLLSAIGVIFYVIISREGSVLKKVALSVTLIAAFLVIFMYLPERITGRFMLTIEQARVGHIETTNRSRYWIAGLKQFAEAPLFGHGASAFREVIIEQPEISIERVAHNVPIQILVDYGLMGIILYFGPIFIALKRLRSHPFMFQRVLFLIFIWFLGALSLSCEAQKMTWYIFGIMLCTVSITVNSAKQTRRSISLINPTDYSFMNSQ